jgi:hypothetical protein
LEKEKPDMPKPEVYGIATKDAKKLAEDEKLNSSMIKGELRDLITNATLVYKNLSDNEEVPDWILEHVTVAADKIHDVKAYFIEDKAETDELKENEVTENGVEIYDIVKEKNNYKVDYSVNDEEKNIVIRNKELLVFVLDNNLNSLQSYNKEKTDVEDDTVDAQVYLDENYKEVIKQFIKDKEKEKIYESIDHTSGNIKVRNLILENQTIKGEYKSAYGQWYRVEWDNKGNIKNPVNKFQEQLFKINL